MTLWRTRDIYRVQSVLRGLMLLFFLLEFFGYCTLGYWYLGLIVIGLQWALVWCLRWGLRWARRGLCGGAWITRRWPRRHGCTSAGGNP